MSASGPDLHAGDVVEGTKYRIVKSLGAGGMGVVYQVVKPPNIQGVLKVMSTELSSHEEHRTRFFDEVRILAQLDHPNIVKVFDYDALPDGAPFYVMELLKGRTVRDALYTMGRLPPRVAYEIARQLLEALQCAHTHEVPVIDRDIKPENIFLHAPRHGEPVVKLIDFGVSAVADRKHDGAFVGTWSYAAPEQIRGERPTPATDLYAVGLVLYEMLAGQGPFDHLTEWALVSAAQLKDIPAPVSTFAPWVPASIVDLIVSALAKDPQKRPKDAYAFAERLFELEWASDGKNPHDFTVEGPVRSFRDRPTRPRQEPDEPIVVAGDGPLSRMLSTVTRGPESLGAADRPSGGRLGRASWSPKGGCVAHEGDKREPTAPSPSALLDGLGANPRRPAPGPGRSPGAKAADEAPSDAATPVFLTPRAGQVVIHAGEGPSRPDGPTTPRAHPVALRALSDGGDARPVAGEGRSVPPIQRDIFSSPEADTRVAPSTRASLWIAAAIVVTGLAIAIVVLVRGGAPAADSVHATRSEPPAPPIADLATSTTSNPAPTPPVTSAPASASPRADAPRPSVVRPPTTRAAPNTSSRNDYLRKSSF